jgi:hypothetical protein
MKHHIHQAPLSVDKLDDPAGQEKLALFMTDCMAIFSGEITVSDASQRQQKRLLKQEAQTLGMSEFSVLAVDNPRHQQ